MADILVQDWLDEFESLTESEVHTYSNEQENNHEIMLALYSVLSEPYRYKSDNVSKNSELSVHFLYTQNTTNPQLPII